MTACPVSTPSTPQRDIPHIGVHVDHIGAGILPGVPFLFVLARRPSQDFVYRQGHRREAVPGRDVGLAVDVPLQSRHLPVGFSGVD